MDLFVQQCPQNGLTATPLPKETKIKRQRQLLTQPLFASSEDFEKIERHRFKVRESSSLVLRDNCRRFCDYQLVTTDGSTTFGNLRKLYESLDRTYQSFLGFSSKLIVASTILLTFKVDKLRPGNSCPEASRRRQLSFWNSLKVGLSNLNDTENEKSQQNISHTSGKQKTSPYNMTQVW